MSKQTPPLGSPLLSLISSVRLFAIRNPPTLAEKDISPKESMVTKHIAEGTNTGTKQNFKTETSLLIEMGAQGPEIQSENPESSSQSDIFLAGEHQIPREKTCYDEEDVEMEDCMSDDQEDNCGIFGDCGIIIPLAKACVSSASKADDGGGDSETIFLGVHSSPDILELNDPEPRIISLLTDSEDSDKDDEPVITNVTPIRHKRPPPTTPSTASSSVSGSGFSDIKITHMTSLNGRQSSSSPKRRRRDSGFRTGPWSYTDRMLLVESMQRGVDFIGLGMKMQRDVDDVFEKFSDVIAAGLYISQTVDRGTQTEGDARP